MRQTIYLNINWHKNNFLRFLIPFFVGILSAYKFQSVLSKQKELLFAGSILIILISIYINTNQQSYKGRWITGILISVAILFIGILTVVIKNEVNYPSHYTNYIDGHQQTFAIKIISEPIRKARYIKTNSKVITVYSKGKMIRTEGKSIIYFPASKNADKIKIGDILLINSTFTSIKPPDNPNQFNYKQFLERRNITHQVYVRNNQWNIIGNKLNKFLSFAHNIRTSITDKLKNSLNNKYSYEVAAAILIGQKDNLSAQILNSYSASGVMHILAVSGLHVGIIYLILLKLISFLLPGKKFKLINTLIIIIMINTYAILTGLTPSVMRATLMFSLIASGRIINRQISIMNIITASFFLLLFIAPQLIYEVGFQLSYLAVIGIVLIYPKIYHLFFLKNSILKYIWAIVCVSLAAQITTFPIVLHYFNNFPTYFILTNLLIVPIVPFLLLLSISTYISTPINLISDFLAYLLDQLLLFMNTIINIISQFPYARIENIYLNSYYLALIYIIICLIILYLYYKKVLILIATLICVNLIIIISCFEAYTITKQEYITFYKIKDSSVLEFTDGRHSIIISSNHPPISKESSLFKYNIAPNHLKNKVKTFRINQSHFPMINFKNKKILLLNHLKVLQCIDSSYLTNIDYLVLQNNIPITIPELMKKINFKNLIIDSSNNIKIAKKWEQDSKAFNIYFYDVNTQGGVNIFI